MLTVGIIEFNRPDLTNIAIRTARMNAGIEHKLLLVVNSPGTESQIKDYDSIIVNDKNLGYSAAANQILNFDKTSDAVVLNSDTKCEKDWLKVLAEFPKERDGKKVGIVVPRLSNRHRYAGAKNRLCGVVDSGCNCATKLEDVKLGEWIFKGWFGFGCVYFNRECVNALGVLKTGHHYFNYHSDKEYCSRVCDNGWWIGHTHYSVVQHLVWGSKNMRGRTWERYPEEGDMSR